MTPPPPLNGDVDFTRNVVNSVNGVPLIRTASGKPTTGTYTMPCLAVDAAGHMYVLTANGTPGTWGTVTTT